MTKEKHQTAAAEAARHIERINAAAATQKDQDAPDNAEGLRRIAETLRAQMPPEAAAQLVIDVAEEMEAAAQQAGDSFKDLPTLDKLCLSCRESYIKGFVAACSLAAQAYALPDDMKP